MQVFGLWLFGLRVAIPSAKQVILDADLFS